MSISTIVLFFYLIVNIVMGCFFYSSGYLGGDFYGEKIRNDDLFLSVFILELVLFASFYFIALFIIKINFSKIKQCNKNRISMTALKRFNIFLMILQACFILFIGFTGFGKISLLIEGETSVADMSSPIKYIFVVLLPDFLFIVYFLIQKENKKTCINLVLYLLSNIIRGWVSGPVLLVMVIFLIKRFSRSKIKIKTVLLIVLSFLVFVPIITSLKFGIRFQNNEVNITSVLQDSYDNSGSYYLRTLNRFQHVSETYSFMNNMSMIRRDYDNGKIALPFFTNDFINITSKIFGFEPQNLLTYGSKVLLDRPFGNIQSGILPWLSISYFFSFSYLVVFILFSVVLSRLCYYMNFDYIMTKNIVIWFTVYYYFHGWIFSYMNLLVAMIIFIIFCSLFKGKVKTVDYEFN